MIRKVYPHGRRKAFNVTYDDGVLQDVRFVALLNKYKLKGTFNLNSELLENEFEWRHDSGCAVKRLEADVAAALYSGHEVASHTLTHPYMDNLTREEILYQLSEDKARLEKLFGREIRGFAVPFEYYSELIEQCVKECGFEYARISEESCSFRPQYHFYQWRATAFHCCEELEELVYQFLENDEELALLQIVGHSYDLDVEKKWELMERVFKVIGEQHDICPMTTIEIVDYLKAMSRVEITGETICNNSDISLWFSIDDTIREIRPNEQYILH